MAAAAEWGAIKSLMWGETQRISPDLNKPMFRA